VIAWLKLSERLDMCGRYTLTVGLNTLQIRFNFEASGLQYRPRYNTAPTQEVMTVTKNGERSAQYMRWGLIPFWAKDVKIGYKMINAKAETVAEKPAFRNALKKRRCLVLADGFYEWKKVGSKKIPHRIILKDQETFAFAGLYEEKKQATGETLVSCTIITCEPNELVAMIHNRMPVILPQESEELWLNPEVDDPKVLTSLLIPFPTGSMEAYPVTTLVNSVKNESPECIEPAL